MNLREYVVLDVLNIASTIHRRNGVFQASAAEMVEVFRTDTRWVAERRIMGFNSHSMAGSLSHLAHASSFRRKPLVKRVGVQRWALTDAGVRVLNA